MGAQLNLHTLAALGCAQGVQGCAPGIAHPPPL
jgi:hypothetical protein